MEAWLDQLDPDVTLPRDAQHLRRIRSARQGVEDADAKLRAAVSAARKAGDSWALIGMALETTRQAAFQRFGKNCPAVSFLSAAMDYLQLLRLRLNLDPTLPDMGRSIELRKHGRTAVSIPGLRCPVVVADVVSGTGRCRLTSHPTTLAGSKPKAPQRHTHPDYHHLPAETLKLSGIGSRTLLIRALDRK